MEVIMRMLHMEAVQKEVLDGVEKTLRTEFMSNLARTARRDAHEMMADIFNREVVVPESFESSCLGAAVLGLYALGRVDSLNVIAGMVGATHRHTPIAKNVEIYRRLLPIYLRSCGKTPH